MKKLLAGAACVTAVLAGAQGVGWAAPINGHNTEELVVRCADDTVTVRIIKPDSGASGWEVDAQRNLTGVRYFFASIEARFYPGVLTTEPTGVDPLFVTATEWGNRTGHEGTVACSAAETFIEGSQTFTGFFDLTATRQEKGS